jgi:hypothetical protein
VPVEVFVQIQLRIYPSRLHRSHAPHAVTVFVQFHRLIRQYSPIWRPGNDFCASGFLLDGLTGHNCTKTVTVRAKKALLRAPCQHVAQKPLPHSLLCACCRGHFTILRRSNSPRTHLDVNAAQISLPLTAGERLNHHAATAQ